MATSKCPIRRGDCLNWGNACTPTAPLGDPRFVSRPVGVQCPTPPVAPAVPAVRQGTPAVERDV